MSLGFPPQPFNTLQHHHTSQTSTGGGEPPIRLRIEAIEIALGRLSQTVRDLSTNLETTHEGREDRFAGIEAELEVLRGVAEKVNEIEVASGFAAMHVQAMVSRNTNMFPNITGDFNKDTKAGTPAVLPTGTQVRLVFPQEQLQDGRLCMGCVCVDTESMALTTGWVIVADMKRKLHYVDSFAI